ncbi:glycosyltransferase family 4 protein [Burkholderia sp. BCC1993]|uniref:glycosyltransferase family 4 protein n=1 Tax=Burkholderia sp. BCC1993 TaxID=2817444 RepID=UPI002AB1C64B|nr:glycosyltransferase family 4 protein [Burkholderia sp. BCC1993]
MNKLTKMKILFISHAFYPSVGGIEVNSEILARNFVNLGHDVVLVTQTPSKCETSFPFAVIRRPGVWQRIGLIMWADVIFHNNPSLRYALIGILRYRKTYVAVRTWIAGVDGKPSFRSRLKRLFLREVKGRIYVSKAVATDCEYAGNVIGNPYRNSVFRNEISYDSRPREFLFAGRLVKDKGADIFIRALAQASSTIKISGVTIVGEGEDRSELEVLAHSQCPDIEIDFVGKKNASEIASIYNQHKILVIPSRWAEPFGNVALEGLACGCIVIVSDGGGLPDAVGECGLVFRRDDVEDLVSQMIRAHENRDLRDNLFSKYQVHLSRHVESAVAERYLEVVSNKVAPNWS